MAHSHHGHREHQVSHRRVDHILKDEPEGAKKHSKSHAFSKVTSKTAAEHHDAKVAGKRGKSRISRARKADGGPIDNSEEFPGGVLDVMRRGRARDNVNMVAPNSKAKKQEYARGGKVKHGGHQTNIAIVVPHRPGAASSLMGTPPMAGPTAGPPVPMGGPAPSPMGAPPPGMPPGMPMRKHGGRVAKKSGGSIDGESTIADDKKWSKRAESNSYFRGGAASGVGREEKAAHMKRKGK